MQVWKKVKQYGNLIVALSMVIGFGATFMLYSTGGNRQPQNQQQQQNNFTAPQDRFKVGSFGKSYREQVVISARDDVAFVNAYYSNSSQRAGLESLQELNSVFPQRLYIQVVNSTNSGDIVTQGGVTEYPSVVVVGGTPSRRGAIPLSTTINPVNTTAVEKAVCNSLTNLGSSFAHCQAIDAF